MNKILTSFAASVLLASCASPHAAVQRPGPGTTAATGVLLDDTIRVLNLHQLRHQGDGCKRVSVESVRPDKAAKKFEIDRAGRVLQGKFSEIWTLNRCGKRIQYRVTYDPDGAGGTNIGIQELEG